MKQRPSPDHRTEPGDPSIILDLVRHQVVRSPEAAALLHQGSSTTYKELWDQSASWAAAIFEAGAGPGSTVGICIDRGPALITAVLAVLRAGAAYVPFDPAYPKQRIDKMLEDARPGQIICERLHLPLFDQYDGPVTSIDLLAAASHEQPAQIDNAGPDDLAYVLFTSGSTGRPKGVAMPHAALFNLIQWQLRSSLLGEGARTLQFAPISFDVSFQEIFSSLCSGGTLVMIDEADRLNSDRLLRTIVSEKIERIIVPYVALQFLAEAVQRSGNAPRCLREVFTSGEQLRITPEIRSLFSAIQPVRFCNQYGPTEGHVVSEFELTGAPKEWAALPPIGSAIDNVQLHVLDERMKPVEPGQEGELYLGGACLAKGYINQQELTDERFVPDPFRKGKGARLYRTGDLVVADDNGDLVYKGRIDGQVKVRGYRIELGEVENALEAYPAIQQAVVAVKGSAEGSQRLVGYYINGSSEELNVSGLRAFLAKTLPDHMLPSAFMRLEELPRTPSGKIDRNALPAPSITRPELDVAYVAPSSPVEQQLAEVWAEVLDMDRVGIDDNFFELGGNSLLSIRAIASLKHQHGTELPIVKLYQHPTVRACAHAISGSQEIDPRTMAAARISTQPGKKDDVAIIGMAGRFPGADNIEQFWNVLLHGRETITRFNDDDLDPSIPKDIREHPDLVKARGIINNADKFDASFFGINPRVADLMDPQQRVFLETAWGALEDAAYDPDRYPGLIGVYVGMGNNTYYTRNVLGHPELIAQIGEFQAMVGNEKDYIATRLAFELNLRGPALSIHTACSTSLTAIAEAYKALQNGTCDMALAGGIAITAPINSGVIYNEGGMYSPDGTTRAFDAEAKGTSFSDGVAIIVLKRLQDAIRDGDLVHAVIKGAAVNNDGRDKASFTAPSVRGQAEVIALAMADAGVTPDTISYVEAHGTATPLGDPIEVEALRLAFGDQPRDHYCGLGSVKTNVGHLTAAAGVAGLLKTTLALRNGTLPASLNFSRPNPALRLEDGPFFIANENRPWPRSTEPRRAGISSFGVGGTNAHVILEEAPVLPASGPGRSLHLLMLSAKTREALDQRTTDLKRFLGEHPEVPLGDVAYTLLVGRKHFKHRRLIVCRDHADAIDALDRKDPLRVVSRELTSAAPGVVFMFPGQGSQYVNMGRDLYETDSRFKERFDACVTRFNALLGEDLEQVMFPTEGSEETAAEKLKQTRYTQPALFTVQYCLAHHWMDMGLKPAALIGHSIGEFAAACIAGVMDLDAATTLVAQRGILMQGLPEGSMLSIRASEETVAPMLPVTCSIAANNGPTLCVASGPDADIASLQAVLEQKEVMCKLLHTSHAFHSPMMEPMVQPYKEVVSKVELHTPRIPIVSTVTASWLKDAEATDPGYWSGHVRATVRFAEAVRTAWEEGDHVMLEVGPRTSASTLARQQSQDPKRQVAIPSLGDHAGDKEEEIQILRAIGQLWQNDITIDADVLFKDQQRRRVQLPTYPFARVRHWVEPATMAFERSATATTNTSALQPDVPSDATPKERLIAQIKDILESSSGIEMAEVNADMSFLEMGLDSLFLTQVALTLQKTFNAKVTFRQLNEELSNLDLLADHLLQYGGPTESRVRTVVPASGIDPTEDAPDLKKTFGAQAKIERQAVDELTPIQRAFLDDLIKAYNQRTSKSKASVQSDRAHMADPRVVTGFKPLIKELIYPLVVDRSKGCHLFDIDGNEYVDILNGFGSSLFGYMPDFIKKACHEQLDKGIEIGPQHPLAGEVTKLLCELSGHDRAAVCNTGSEAVLGAMRIARTVTGRSLIVAFSGSYHGINDEVIIRGSKSKRSFPAAPGIMPEAVQNMLILDYGTPESLEIIRERAHELAAVLVEPVQSRRPEFRPVDFLQEVRTITRNAGCALIFDEVITGYRMHPGGAQALFGVPADLGTYGKVIGGGMPIGAISGRKEFMDALDGGHWQFGDASIPEVGVTYFAGTFVRHPLTMAAAKASLQHLKDEGPALQERLNDLTDRLANETNRIFTAEKAPMWMVNFGSLFKVKYDETVPYIELFFTLLRLKGIHVWDGFPCFLTTAHTEKDLHKVVSAIADSVHELKEAGFLPERSLVLEKQNRSLNGHATRPEERVILATEPPVPEARLGTTLDGGAAWFVPDPEREGKYLMMVEEN